MTNDNKNYITLTKEQLAQMSPQEKVQLALKIAEYYHYPECYKEEIKTAEKYWGETLMTEIIEDMLTAEFPFTANAYEYNKQIS